MADCKEQWVKHMRAKGLLPSTVKLYSACYDALNQEVGEPIELKKEQLAKWVDEKAQLCSASTTSNRISALRCFYKWAVRSDLRPDDPTIILEAPKRRQGIPKPVADLEAVLDKLDEEDIISNEKKPSQRRRVGETRDMAVFMVETGLRISEACAVELDGPAPEVITVIGKGAKEAFVLLSPLAREAIDRLGGKIGLSPRAVQRRFERADFHPHQLRHTFATRLVMKGVEIGTISKLCRHSSPAITMTYAQYDLGTMREALER